LGDVAELDCLHDDRVPPIVTDPVGLTTAVGGVREPIEDSHDAIVAQYAFYFAVGHGVSWDRDPVFLQRVFRSVNRARNSVKVNFFDTHAHIHRSRSSRGTDPRELLKRALGSGVRALLVPAVTAEDWLEIAQIPDLEGIEVYFSLGLHPYFVMELNKKELGDLLAKLRGRLIRKTNNLKAVGECGLHFRRGGEDTREIQVEAFRAQIELARETGLPMTIHCVGAHQLTLELLRERPTPPSVMHAYSGSAELGAAFVEAGHYLSFAANVCIPNARKAPEAARATPRDRLLIETDTPDQTPPGRRPADNEPAFIVDVARKLAELRGESVEELAAYTWTNARRVFALDGQSQ
jgi:TatD DNase family protein